MSRIKSGWVEANVSPNPTQSQHNLNPNLTFKLTSQPEQQSRFN